MGDKIATVAQRGYNETGGGQGITFKRMTWLEDMPKLIRMMADSTCTSP